MAPEENTTEQSENTLNDILEKSLKVNKDTLLTLHSIETTLYDTNKSLETSVKAIHKLVDKIQVGVTVAAVVILILGMAIGYLLIKPQKILYVTFEDDIKTSDKSDTTQVENALKNGGAIRVEDSNDGYEDAFGREYLKYGAENKKGYMWTRGAALNYIGSKGWKIVQSPGLGTIYIFTK